ncbi:AMP-binding protein [Neomegalonema sp.]|uniref:AMP-binding protein n=1 Tax=Neomegalonema sp. TaxID=2039713 RepID=UPI0026036E72|nr:AMP-binding protein [Neomegalonema sp.]MDD2869934.1 AMP-binding protein [Neomegalonema sp.]
MAQASDHAHADTFPKLLAEHARLRPTRPAMRHKDLGIWRTWSWAEAQAEVRAYAAGLSDLGLKRGDHVAVVGANRPWLYWTILAAQWLGAIPVPVYADSVAEEMAYVLDHAEASFAVAQDQEQVDKLLSIREKTPRLRTILYDEPRGLRDYDHTHLHAVAGVVERGRERLKDPDFARWIEAERLAGGPDDISIMLYTSGTTGRSKGVMLTAGGCIAAARDTVAFDKLTDQDELLAYLPLAWVGDHYMNYAQALVAGFCVACPESAETVEIDLREIGPTYYFAPPRVFENLLTRILIRMEDASKLKRRMFHHYLEVARRWGEKILNGEEVPFGARLSYKLGNIFVYGPLKNVLGFSRIRTAYTAGEAIGPELFSFYRALGMNLKQLYGQTEAFLFVTAHKDGHVGAKTVGPPLPNVEIRLSDAGEVLYKSPGQFVGYFKEPEKTVETMTEDGFVRTGDAGFFDAKGELNIIDRAKDVGKLRSGELFAPKYIENRLKFFAHIKEAVAFGQDRDHATAMINIDMSAVGDWAERRGIAYASYQELAARPEVYELIAGHVAEANRGLSEEPRMAAAQVKRFVILHKELDADDGEMTRTQKVRRGFIAERYAPIITALYDGSDLVDVSTEVTFEDGRKGVISGRLRVEEAKTHAPAHAGAAGARKEAA